VKNDYRITVHENLPVSCKQRTIKQTQPTTQSLVAVRAIYRHRWNRSSYEYSQRRGVSFRQIYQRLMSAFLPTHITGCC